MKTFILNKYQSIIYFYSIVLGHKIHSTKAITIWNENYYWWVYVCSLRLILTFYIFFVLGQQFIPEKKFTQIKSVAFTFKLTNQKIIIGENMSYLIPKYTHIKQLLLLLRYLFIYLFRLYCKPFLPITSSI